MSLCFSSLEVSKVFNSLIAKELSLKGHQHLSSSLIVIFPYLKSSPLISISSLATKMGYTRQAMHKNLLKLEELGYVEVVKGVNKKKKTVVLSAQGEHVITIAETFIGSIYTHLREQLGDEALQQYLTTQSQILSFLTQQETMIEGIRSEV